MTVTAWAMVAHPRIGRGRTVRANLYMVSQVNRVHPSGGSGRNQDESHLAAAGGRPSLRGCQGAGPRQAIEGPTGTSEVHGYLQRQGASLGRDRRGKKRDFFEEPGFPYFPSGSTANK